MIRIQKASFFMDPLDPDLAHLFSHMIMCDSVNWIPVATAFTISSSEHNFSINSHHNFLSSL
jgi:hypothetical protein